MTARIRPFLFILAVALLGLACNTITGSPEDTPVPATATAPQATNTTVASDPADPIPTPTTVPPQTPTPLPTISGSPTGASWPAAVPLPDPLSAGPPDPAQQATFDLLAQAEPPQRDDVELARLYQGWQGTLPNSPSPAQPQAVGDHQNIKISNHDDNTVSTIDAELLVISDNAYFWFDTGPGSVRPAEDELTQIAGIFDDIYAQNTIFFGTENRPGIDGDPRIHIVNASPLALCNVTVETASSCGLAGYFSSYDTIPAEVDQRSNAREMFVMNSDYFGSAYYLNVLAHELRHMIEDNYDRGDIDWAVEGSAVLAEDLLDLGSSGTFRANSYLLNPDQQLNRWTDGNSQPYYGQGYLLSRFIYDRLGQTLFREYATHPANGLRAVDAVAEANNLDFNGQSLWLDWLVAQAIHQRSDAPFRFQLQIEDLDTVQMNEISTLPAGGQETVHQYAADYYHLSGSNTVNINFEGSRQVPLIDTAAASGSSMWLANRANFSHMQLTREVDLSQVNEAILEYNVYHDIEVGYDFAYLFVSPDNGQSWQPLTADNMQGLNAVDNPSGNALTDRFYTGRSNGWIRETVDLSPYAGQLIQLRFAYITDQILTFGGIALDNIAIPAVGFYDDTESEDGGWQANGFTRVTSTVPQQWHLQLITFPDGRPQVELLSLSADGRLEQSLDLAAAGNEAILIIAASAPMTLELAHYRLNFE